MNSNPDTQDWTSYPDSEGHFGPYGGRFVAETLMDPLAELLEAYERFTRDAEFQAEFDRDLAHYVGRPSPLYLAERWSRELGGAQIYLKREDLNHTGAHKVNNTIGQALLAKRMARRGLSPRRVPVSMVSQPQQWRRDLALSALFIWARRTLNASRLMFIA